MPTTYTTLLGLALPATGELSGTWGDTVNSYITQYVDSAVAGAQIISGSQTAVTLSTTNGSALSQAGAGATGSAQYAIIRCTGNPASLLTITAPAANKVYLVINATSTSQSVKVVGTGPTTGVTVAASRAALIAWNGSDFVLIATTDIAQMSGFGTGVATALGQNVTGSGGIVLATSPTLVTPTLGAASATSVALAAGAAGTPSLTATGDLDTGLWFPAANTLAASTGGSERLRIDSTGKVGIGTTSPTYALDVQTSTVVTQARFAASATGGATILSGGGSQGIWCGGCDYNGTAFVARATTSSQMRTDGGLITFYTDSSLTSGNTFTPSERFRITSGGDVGIGKTTPEGKLDVSGAGTITSRVGTTDVSGTAVARFRAVYLGGGGGTTSIVDLRAGDAYTYLLNESNVPMLFGTNNTERMRITSGGDVGIGTSSPSVKLDVTGQGRASTGMAVGTDASAFTPSGLNAIPNYGTGFITSTSITTLSGFGGASFYTNQLERMRITQGGDVGIGTTLPASKLSVYQASSVQIQASTASIDFRVQCIDANGAAYVGAVSNHPLMFTVNNSERMRIDTSGNVLVATTSVTIGNTDGYVFNAGGALNIYRTSGASQAMIGFGNGGNFVGDIRTSTTATSYNTSSDYRLKHDIVPMTGALTKIAALKPVTYKWNADGSYGEGFIAHELQAVVPQCVSGQKDAVDENGKPRYQGVDTSFLVATLTAAIQEQQAIIKSLTDRIAALEAKGA